MKPIITPFEQGTDPITSQLRAAGVVPARGGAAQAVELWTWREACTALNIGKATLDRMARDGRVTRIKIGGASRYPSTIVADALAGKMEGAR